MLLYTYITCIISFYNLRIKIIFFSLNKKAAGTSETFVFRTLHSWGQLSWEHYLTLFHGAKTSGPGSPHDRGFTITQTRRTC